MSRLTGANQAQATAGSVRPCWLIDLEFPSGTVYVTDAGKRLVYNGNTYGIDGTFLGVSGVSGRADGKPQSVGIRLSATSAIKTALANDNWQFSKVKVYFGFRDENGDLAANPNDPIVYLMSTDSHQYGDNAQITLTCEPHIVKIARKNTCFPSPLAQKALKAGDTVFDNVQAIIGREIEWGGSAYQIGGGAVGGGVMPERSTREDPLRSQMRI